MNILRSRPTNTTKQSLVNKVAETTGLTQADIKIAVEQLLSTISDILCTGKSIEIRGFGTFYSKKRKPRPARNPKTGEVIPLLERYVPLFKFSSDIKKSVEESIKKDV